MSYYEEAKRKYREMPFGSEAEKRDFEVPLKDWGEYVSKRDVGEEVFKLRDIEGFQKVTDIKVGEKTARVVFIKKSLTDIQADAVINAANESLLGGGGIDHAIHSAAGRNLVRECAYLNGCQVGEAVITKGYNLPSKYVIHTVAPLLDENNTPDHDSLLSCYVQTLKLCDDHQLTSLIIPLLGCGFYAFPIMESAKIVLSAIKSHVARDMGPTVTTFILSFTESSALKTYLKVFDVPL
eukprot:TRINITY_DN6795_c4_g1_i1.p1 TRINITY_DN6795_c4_g1~~TRINITY_DN6795_c4_g1_i1.p1  ORF type:complete len:238 (+),score=31.90 TRINITY_DN6795_c4_g1_i1:42-755(+)